MKSASNYNHDDTPDIGRVYRSLKRSKVRRELYEYLCDIYPLEASVRELARARSFGLADALGAALGDGRRYSVEDSLLGLGLVIHERVGSFGDVHDVLKAKDPGLRDRLKEYSQRTGGSDRIESERATGG